MSSLVLTQMKDRNLGQGRVGIFTLDPDIRTASTPPSALYHEPAYFAHQQDAVLPARGTSWGTPAS